MKDTITTLAGPFKVVNSNHHPETYIWAIFFMLITLIFGTIWAIKRETEKNWILPVIAGGSLFMALLISFAGFGS